MTARAFLILDDSASDRGIIERVLLEAFPSAEILDTGDAVEARNMCAAFAIDCVLLDYSMPKIDGAMFAKDLRGAYPYLPIVMVTGVGDEMLVGHAIRCGVSDYIPKSRINPDSIQRTIERAIEACALTRIIAEQRAELENFAYALAHDFKQPIRQLRTFAQLISEQAEGDSESLQRNLDFLNQAARRLGDLVDVMSQYTLLNETPEMKRIEVSAVMEAVSAELRLEVEDHGAALGFEGAGNLYGNETLLSQVLRNLIVNGVKYNKSDVPRVDVRVEMQGGQCVIAVSDNGIGIEQQYLADVFRPLMRLHAAGEYPGTGLGLTLARKAVLAQGGVIWCESEPGIGSTFFVRIPTTRAEQARQLKGARQSR